MAAGDLAAAGDIEHEKVGEENIDKENYGDQAKVIETADDRGDGHQPWIGGRSRRHSADTTSSSCSDSSSLCSSGLSRSFNSGDCTSRVAFGSSGAALTRENVQLLQQSLEESARQGMGKEGVTINRRQSLSDAVANWKNVCRDAPGCQAVSYLTPRRRVCGSKTPEEKTVVVVETEVATGKSDTRMVVTPKAATMLARSKSAPLQIEPLLDIVHDATYPVRVIDLMPQAMEGVVPLRTDMSENVAPTQSMPARPALKHIPAGVPRNITEGACEEHRLLAQAGLLNVLTLQIPNSKPVSKGRMVTDYATVDDPKNAIPEVCGANTPHAGQTSHVGKEADPRSAGASLKQGLPTTVAIESPLHAGKAAKSVFRNELTVILPTVPFSSVVSDSLNDTVPPQPNQENQQCDSIIAKLANRSVSFDLNSLPKSRSLSVVREAKSPLPCIRRASESRVFIKSMLEASNPDTFDNPASEFRRNGSFAEYSGDATHLYELAHLRLPTTRHGGNNDPAEYTSNASCKTLTDVAHVNHQATGITSFQWRPRAYIGKQFGTWEGVLPFQLPSVHRRVRSPNSDVVPFSEDNFSEVVCDASGCVDFSTSQEQRWSFSRMIKKELSRTEKQLHHSRSESLDTTASLFGSSKASVIDSFADDVIFDQPSETMPPVADKLETVPEHDNDTNWNVDPASGDGNDITKCTALGQLRRMPELVDEDAKHDGELLSVSHVDVQKIPHHPLMSDDRRMFRAIAKSAAATEAVMSRHCLQERPIHANVRDIVETFYELNAELARGNAPNMCAGRL